MLNDVTKETHQYIALGGNKQTVVRLHLPKSITFKHTTMNLDYSVSLICEQENKTDG